jgi:D-aspartate ligase
MSIRTELPPAFVCGEIGLVRSLGEAGIPLVVGSYYKDNIALYSRYCGKTVLFSHTASRTFVEELIAFGKNAGRKMVFFSDDDRAVLSFSQYRDELKDYFYFNLPDHNLVETLLDKRKFGVLADRLKLAVPKTYTPSSAGELNEIIPLLEFPCIIKPAHKDDWWHPEFRARVGAYRKAIVCDTPDMLRDFYSRVSLINPNIVVQEYIEGDDLDLYSVNMYLDEHSNLKAYFIGRKLRVYPIHAGVGSLVETVQDDEIVAAALDAAVKLGMKGHFNIQFKRDKRTGKVKIMEAHARNSLWCYLATASGLNITAIAYYDMIGRPCPETGSLAYGVKWVDLNKDLKALRDYRKTGEWTIRSWLSSLRGKKAFHVHSLKDPLPLAMDSWFLLKRRRQGTIAKGAAPHA